MVLGPEPAGWMDDDWLLSRLAECVQDEVTQVAPLTANVSFCDSARFSQSKTRTSLRVESRDVDIPRVRRNHLVNSYIIWGNKYNTTCSSPDTRYLHIMFHSKWPTVCNTRGCSFSVQNYDAEKASNATDLLPSTRDTSARLTCQPRLELRPQMDV